MKALKATKKYKSYMYLVFFTKECPHRYTFVSLYNYYVLFFSYTLYLTHQNNLSAATLKHIYSEVNHFSPL